MYKWPCKHATPNRNQQHTHREIMAIEIPPYILELRTMHVVRTYFTVWRLIGIWWLPSDSTMRRLLAKCVFFLTNCVFILLMFVDLCRKRNVTDLIAAFLGITVKFMITFKTMMLMHNRLPLVRIFELTAAVERHCIDAVPAERQHLMRANRVAQRLYAAVQIGVFSTVLSGFLSAALPKARLMMWHMWFPFDWRETASVWPYRAALGYQIVSNVHHMLLFATTDTYGLSFYCTLGATIDILTGRLRRLATDASETAAQRQRALVECLRYHLLCMEYRDRVNVLLEVHFAMMFSASSLLLCVLAYTLSTMDGASSTAQWIFIVTYLANISVQLFIPCYFGSQLQTKSAALSHAAFEGGWPEDGAGKQAFRKALLLFMMGAEKPIRMRTWQNTFVIELPTFVIIYRAAYSLLSFVSGF